MSEEWRLPEVMEFLKHEILSREWIMQPMRSNKEKDNQNIYKPFIGTDTTCELKQRNGNLSMATALHIARQRTHN